MKKRIFSLVALLVWAVTSAMAYNITINQVTGGTITAENNSHKYTSSFSTTSGDIKFTATPAEGYRFAQFTYTHKVDGFDIKSVSATNGFIFELNSDITITAIFEPLFGFTAQENITVAFSVEGTQVEEKRPSLMYSLDNKTWSDYTLGTGIPLESGSNVYFKAKSTNSTFTNYGGYIHFTSTGKVAAFGNIMALIKYDGSITEVPKLAFYKMFLNCTGLTAAPELPGTTLNEQCYESMFQGCTGLTSTPELPATTLTKWCYTSMFQGCTHLTTASTISATTMGGGECCYMMFKDCTGLTTAPALPATSLVYMCYQEMFAGCTSLTVAPALPATNLTGYTYCYQQMFQGCTGLIIPPALPATNLADYCYYLMFQGCTSLASVPNLPATSLSAFCYTGMFAGCTSLQVYSQSNPGPGIEWCIPSGASGDALYSKPYQMFENTSGLFTGNPTFGKIYYISSLPGVQLNDKGFATYSSSMPCEVSTSGVTAYTASVSGNSIALSPISSSTYIPAGMPVILYGGESMANTVVTFQSPTSSTAASNVGNALCSTLVVSKSTASYCNYALGTKSSEGYTFALSGDQFLHYTGSAFIPNRAYLYFTSDPAPAGEVKGMNIEFADEDETGIIRTPAVQTQDDEIFYNLAGQRVNSSVKGIVIKNGVKYLKR